jgi:hypothetical protein
MVLVLPARVRGVGAMLGAVFAAVAGVATLSAGWHRPSDAVASLLLVGVWAAIAGIVIVSVQRRHGGVQYGHANRLSTGLLTLAGLALLAFAALALRYTNGDVTTPVDQLTRTRLFIAYAGGAVGIAGTASLVFAAVLATAHQVVPQVVPRQDGVVESDRRGVRQPA